MASSSTANASDSPCSYFLGSERPEDYIIDLDLAPEAQPLDVQAYLQCVATVADFDEYEQESTLKPYQSRLDKVAEGTQMLRETYHDNGPGIWLAASDITPEDMASCPRNPWIGALRRTNKLASMPEIWEHFEECDGEDALIFGNIRIALPPGFVGPAESADWLPSTFAVYGRRHPALKAAETMGDLTSKTMGGVTDIQLYEIGKRGGLYYDLRPVLPLTPDHQEWFDRDPKAYDEWYNIRMTRNMLMPFPPVGYRGLPTHSERERKAPTDDTKD